MAKSVDEFNKKRLRSSNITVVVSIALVLFLLGLMGLILINAQKYSDYLKEQLVVNAYFDENYDAKDSAKIAKQESDAVQQIQKMESVKRTTYISKKMASSEAKKSLGINSEALFEEDIFPASVEIALKPQYTDSTKIGAVLTQIKAVPGIVDVKNDSDSQKIYDNLNKILKWILAFCVLFLVLAIVLINNSIRLKVFSKRFIIKTMQLVGAKRRFILKPFIIEAVVLGAIGSFIGLLALFGVWYYFTTAIKTPFVQDTNQYIWLVVSIFGVGLFITVLSTIIATWRFLRSNVDDLYYS
ncbi:MULTISPECIES: cell division protein FtsX [Chryseobacterium]|jgi:cell division transport system permease protein|uniref:Cell division protein FtsX n=1 Tax=Chryseobacterium indoltheticum TaxID=254 RepID=A0A381FG73_9FLAO|nr:MULTISPECIES: permease-like cell division protein FtsX [Chryseobacterium]AZA60624.1 FtsX-like permease family protein [Chryseobacterium indoltheticum]AZA73876.1 FtsX-like permease family protein [Chryseobacterium indoltheticum]MDF2834034.1 transporter permease [Chryseobacterium indoltheticum]MDQ8143638.1 permease-like cell division protein FtsX [Chryseobacterium sp. CFS15]SIR20350.1 cell division transport system permease protein [Chryseobacterium indoltheticum]